MLEVDMHIDHLAEFMFTKNVNNALIDLSLNGLESAKDFFYLCLDLFCKGLILMHGNGSHIVSVNSLTIEQFQQLRDKMNLAGIDIILDTQPPDVDIGKDDIYLNFAELQQMPDSLPLEDYKFIMKCCEFTYVISFRLFHINEGNCNSHRARV